MPSEQAATFKSTWWEIVLPTWLPEKFRTTHLGPFLIIVWAISIGLFLLSFLSPNTASQTTLLLTACAFLVLSGAAIMGLPVGVAVHIGLVISSLHLLNEAFHSGGMFSVAMGWFALLPLLPLFAIGVAHAVAWFIVSLILLCRCLVGKRRGVVPAAVHHQQRHSTLQWHELLDELLDHAGLAAVV